MRFFKFIFPAFSEISPKLLFELHGFLKIRLYRPGIPEGSAIVRQASMGMSCTDIKNGRDGES